MTIDTIALKEPVDKGSDAVFLREIIALIAAQQMEMEVGSKASLVQARASARPSATTSATATANRTAFEQESAEDARGEWRIVADRQRTRLRSLAGLMDWAEYDVLAYHQFPAEHRRRLHSTNPLEQHNGEVKERKRVVGIFSKETAIVRLVGTILLE